MNMIQKQRGLRACTQLLRLEHWGLDRKGLELQRRDVVACQKYAFNSLNDFISKRYSPLEVIVLSVLGFVLVQRLWKVFRRAFGTHSVPCTRVIIMAIADLPIIRGIVRREEAKVISKLRDDIMTSRQGKEVEKFLQLPQKGQHDRKEIFKLIDTEKGSGRRPCSEFKICFHEK